MGIEPTLFAWEAKVLPLNYTRITLQVLILDVLSRRVCVCLDCCMHVVKLTGQHKCRASSYLP